MHHETATPNEVESALLCACLSDGLPAPLENLSAQVCQELKPSDFEDQKHRLIFLAVLALRAKGISVDRRTVQAELEANGNWPKVGIYALAFVAYDMPDFGHIGGYVKVLKTRTAQKGVLKILPEIDKRVRNGEPLVSIVGDIGERFTALASDQTDKDLFDLRDSFGNLEERLERPLTAGLVGISTGFRELDNLTKGFQPGQVIVLAGHTGKGKTTLAGCFALTAIQAKVATAYYSLEMSRADVSKRLLSNLSGVSLGRIQTGHMTDADKATVREAKAYLSRLPLVLQDTETGAITASGIAASLRKARTEHGIRLAVVDYLGLIARDPGEKFENRNIEVSQLSRAMKLLAGELAIPIIVLHQLNRSSATRSADTKPVLSDLRDSGSIEQDADIVLFVHHKGSSHSQVGQAPVPDAEIIIGKHRNGPEGLITVKADLEHFKFSDF